MAKYIFITGGVTSSLGKGILAASLGKLLQSRGYRVAIQKLEPYLNVDAGTMSPYEHGECYVTNDGVETDLDLGHYERFLDAPTSRSNYITTGYIYSKVIEKEREGGFLGKTVQVVPHITDAIKESILELGKSNEYDFIISEVGGCVGDIESLPYIEAIRQLRFSLPKNNFLSIHLTLIPYLSKADELKTKPTQHSVRQLQSMGIQPDIIVCRTEKNLTDSVRQKIALFCSIDAECVFEAIDVDTIYKVPLFMQEEGLDKKVLEILKLEGIKDSDLTVWKNFIKGYTTASSKIKIGLVGKYTEVPDAYKSINEALIHAGVHQNVSIDLKLIPAAFVNSSNVIDYLGGLQGIIIGPGYGKRGIEGKIAAIQYARLHSMPTLGICLGMQCMVVEFARNVMNWENAASTELDTETQFPVIDIMQSQIGISQLGGTNRLGAQPCLVKNSSRAYKCYSKERVVERHRHRYEFNDKYAQDFKKFGMHITGIHPESHLTEIIEIENHPWYIGVQFHPELQSTPQYPHPLFVGFVNASKNSNRIA
jgi:CTP synthase